MGHIERPCPSCGAPLALDAPLVTCASCDRDFAVDVEPAARDPYRGAPRVELAPGARPPPDGGGVAESGTVWRIARGPGPVLGPVGSGVLVALLVGPMLLLRFERAPAAYIGILALLILRWAAPCIVVWALGALVVRTRFEEVWLDSGVLGWRRGCLGFGVEKLALAGDVAGVHLHQGHVRVRFGTGKTWHVGAALRPIEAGMAWLARRLRNATRSG
jgi:hypothetical protein